MSNANSEDMRRLLREQKRKLKEANYQMYLSRLEKAEQHRLDTQLFHKTYENSAYVSQVRLYKQVKNDLFNWGQLLTIVSDFIMVISFITLGFILISMALNSYPFIISTVINQSNARRFFPTKENSSNTYCWLLHILSLITVLMCLSFGVMGKLLQQKRRIDYAIKLERISIVSIFIFNICFILIMVFGNLLFQTVNDSLLECSTEESFEKPKNIKMCNVICLEAAT